MSKNQETYNEIVIFPLYFKDIIRQANYENIARIYIYKRCDDIIAEEGNISDIYLQQWSANRGPQARESISRRPRTIFHT